MKYQELSRIALKIMGIYFIVTAMPNIINGVLLPFTGLGSVQGAQNINWTVEIVNWVLVSVLYAFVGYLLTFHTDMIMRILKFDLSNAEEIPIENKSNNDTLAFSLLGLYFAVPALGSIVSNVVKLLFAKPGPSGYFQEPYWISLWPKHFIELIIGVALIMGKKRIIKFWNRLRPLSSANETEE